MIREQILNEIENLMGRIGQTDYSNEDYPKYQESLKKWQDILAAFDAAEKSDADSLKTDLKERRQRRLELLKMCLDFAKTGLAVGGTLIAIILIISAEEAVPKILNSKSMSFVTKILPKIV